jgi:apolipoprotein N-acyltransferase
MVLLVFMGTKLKSKQAVSPAYPITIAVVSTTFDSRFDLADVTGELRQTALDNAVGAASRLPVAYIILPEDSRYLQTRFGADLQGSNLINAYRFAGGDTSKMLIDSSRVDTNPGEVGLRSYLLDGKSNQVFEFDKQYLVPQGEFMPYSTSYLFSLFGFKEDVNLQALDSAYRPGPKLQVGTIPNNIPAVLFCSEAVNPFGVANIIRNRPVPFVASPVSHAWFHNSTILSAQVDTMLRIQAVMNSVFIVSAGNMEESKVYTPTGIIKFGDLKASGEYWSVTMVSLP